MNLIESTPTRPTPLGLRALPILSYVAAVFADIVGAKEGTMIPDPNTPEGRDEIARRSKKRLKEIQGIKDRTKENPDEEPWGKLTSPNDIDRVKDRRKEK